MYTYPPLTASHPFKVGISRLLPSPVLHSCPSWVEVGPDCWLALHPRLVRLAQQCWQRLSSRAATEQPGSDATQSESKALIGRWPHSSHSSLLASWVWLSEWVQHVSTASGLTACQPSTSAGLRLPPRPPHCSTHKEADLILILLSLLYSVFLGALELTIQ